MKENNTGVIPCNIVSCKLQAIAVSFKKMVQVITNARGCHCADACQSLPRAISFVEEGELKKAKSTPNPIEAAPK